MGADGAGDFVQPRDQCRYISHSRLSSHRKELQASPHLTARWPSGLRRQLKEPECKPCVHSYASSRCNSLVRKGVGSNPTLVNPFAVCVRRRFLPFASSSLLMHGLACEADVNSERDGPPTSMACGFAKDAPLGRSGSEDLHTHCSYLSINSIVTAGAEISKNGVCASIVCIMMLKPLTRPLSSSTSP